MPKRRPGDSHCRSGLGGRPGRKPVVTTVTTVSAVTTGTRQLVGEAQGAQEAAQIGHLLEQARTALGSLNTSSLDEGHADIYAEVHRLLTQALRATVADV